MSSNIRYVTTHHHEFNILMNGANADCMCALAKTQCFGRSSANLEKPMSVVGYELIDLPQVAQDKPLCTTSSFSN